MKTKKILIGGLALAVVAVAGVAAAFCFLLPARAETDSGLDSFVKDTGNGVLEEAFPADAYDRLFGKAPSEGSSQEGTPFTTHTGATFAYRMQTHFDIELPVCGSLLAGREYWEEGEEIVFRVSAEEPVRLRVEIYPAEPLEQYPDYNSYGGSVGGEEITAGQEPQEVAITIPKSGEYGFMIVLVATEEDQKEFWDAFQSGEALRTIKVSLDINKPFLNTVYQSDRPETPEEK